MRTVLENDFVRTFLSNMPITPGHALVMPKQHVATVSEMTAEERAAVCNLAENIKGVLVRTFDAQGFNMAWNEGEVAGQSVPHFHLHIVPRKQGDTGVVEYEPRKFLYRPGSRAEFPQQELQALTTILKDALSET